MSCDEDLIRLATCLATCLTLTLARSPHSWSVLLVLTNSAIVCSDACDRLVGDRLGLWRGNRGRYDFDVLIVFSAKNLAQKYFFKLKCEEINF